MGGNGLEIAQISAAVSAQIDDKIGPAALLHDIETSLELGGTVTVKSVKTDICRVGVKSRKRIVCLGERSALAAEGIGSFAVTINDIRRGVRGKFQRVRGGSIRRRRAVIACVQRKIPLLRTDKGNDLGRTARQDFPADSPVSEDIHPRRKPRQLSRRVLHNRPDEHFAFVLRKHDPRAFIVSLALGNQSRIFLGRVVCGEDIGHGDVIQILVHGVHVHIAIVFVLQQIEHPAKFAQTRICRIEPAEPARSEPDGKNDERKNNGANGARQISFARACRLCSRHARRRQARAAVLRSLRTCLRGILLFGFFLCRIFLHRTLTDGIAKFLKHIIPVFRQMILVHVVSPFYCLSRR